VDPAERADILFAQLDVLLAHGHLDAARELALRLRRDIHAHPPAAGPRRPAPEGERATVLEPLANILRQQQALHRDIREAAEASPATTSGAFDIVEPGALGVLLERSVEEIFYTLDELAEPLDALSANRLRTGAGRAVTGLRKAVRSGRVRPVRDALQRVRTLVGELVTEQDEVEQLDERLQVFIRHLDPTGSRAQGEELADRQAALAGRTVPPAGTEQDGDPLRAALTGAREAMIRSRGLLLRHDPEGAEPSARTACRELSRALGVVDRALGKKRRSASPTGFLAPFVAGQQPEWDLPSALGLRFHEKLEGLPREARRELDLLVRTLMSSDETHARVEFHLDPGDSGAPHPSIDVRVTADWAADDARYAIRLSFQETDEGGLRPVPVARVREIHTYGGRAVVLLATELEDCSLTVLRLHDLGQGPRIGYVEDEPDALPLASFATQRLEQDFVVDETLASPARAEVLAWLDDIDNQDDVPIPEEHLRPLDIPWYDPSDLVDLLRPIHEELTLDLLRPVGQESFPGIAWLDEGSQAWLALSLGKGGRAPKITVPRSLIQYLAWIGKRSEKRPGEPTFEQMLAALQLHLGLKLAFYDSPDQTRLRPWIHRAARSLERAYLESRGLPPGCVRDLLTELAARTAADAQAEAEDASPWERWSRHAENLFDARAGEELLRGGRLPASVVFGSLRGTLAKALNDQGQLAAARSAEEFASLQDAAILFGNLVIDPASQEGVLIAGDSKIGKSSITARLVAGATRGVAPWRFGASDRILVMVPRPGEGPDGSGRAVATASPAHRRFGQWTEELWYRDARKREVKPRDHVVSRRPVPLRSVVFIHRDGGEHRSTGLAPGTVGDLIVDFQTRFGFQGSRRFWRSLFQSVSVLDLSIRRRGADTFHEAADAIRKHMRRAEIERGLASARMLIIESDDAWYGVAPDRARMRVTRVGRDGLDLDYLLHADGTASAWAAHLGKVVQLSGSRGTLTDLGTLVPLENGRVLELYDQPHYRVGSTRMMPLTPEYFRSTMSGPCFYVPALPEAVTNAVLRLMSRDRSGRWKHYLEQ
jgi:hypothetical protein